MAATLPICSKCKNERPCLEVESIFGVKNICIGECFVLWEMMVKELKKRTQQLLIEHHTDFFEEPTRPDIPALLVKK